MDEQPRRAAHGHRDVAVFAFLPEFVQTPATAGYGFTASVTESGLILLPSTITMFLMGQFAGRLARRISSKSLVIFGCLVGAGSVVVLAVANAHKWQLYVASGLMGIGFGLAFSAMSALVVTAVSPGQTGVASGMSANIRTIGGSIGTALVATIVAAQVGATGVPAKSAYVVSFLMLAGGLVLGGLAGFLVPATRRLTPEEQRMEHAGLAMVAGGTVIGYNRE